jgi:hypothetical protein
MTGIDDAFIEHFRDVGKINSVSIWSTPAADVKGPWYSLEHTFKIEPRRGEAAAAADHRQGRGERPAIEWARGTPFALITRRWCSGPPGGHHADIPGRGDLAAVHETE